MGQVTNGKAKMVIDKIKTIINLRRAKKLWRRNNSHNLTQIVNNFNQACVKVGSFTYGALYVLTFRHDYILKVGNFCSIANNVKFLLGCNHSIEKISTYPFKVQAIHSEPFEATSKGDIIVDDDVWIGENAIILSGVHIGQGAVVAAGAVVTKDVPPYAIVGGVPAKVIKYRFSSEIIQQLMKLDYSKLTEDMIRERINDLYTSLDGKTPEEVEKLLEWFPKKS